MVKISKNTRSKSSQKVGFESTTIRVSLPSKLVLKLRLVSVLMHESAEEVSSRLLSDAITKYIKAHQKELFGVFSDEVPTGEKEAHSPEE